MVARRRRALSNSTVATVDETAIPYFKESSILKKVPLATHSDEWPCFFLVDATIYDKHGRMANQLSVDLDGPFVIRGKLALDKDQDKYLVPRPGKCRDACIQVENSASFAVALKEEENGPPLPVLWASGEAGWYEIVPSEKYKAIGNAIFSSIALYYSMSDQYEASRGKKKSKKKPRPDIETEINEMLFNFAVQEGEGLTLPEAIQRCDDNVIFFLSHFTQKSAPFYKWLASRHPLVLERLANRAVHDNAPLMVPGLEPADPADPRYRVKSTSLEANASLRRSRGGSRQQSVNNTTSQSKSVDLASRPKRETTTSRSDVQMADDDSPVKKGFEALLEYIEEEREAMEAAKGDHKLKKTYLTTTAKSWHTKIYLNCSIPNYGGGTEVCEYYAKDLVERLGKEWHDSPLYKWAKQNVNTKPAYEHITKDKIVNLVRRQRKPRPSAVDKAPRTPQAQASSSGKYLPQTGRTGGKRSVLRPAYGKKRSRGDGSDNDDEMDIDSDDDSAVPVQRKKSRLDSKHDHAADASSNEDDADLPESPLAKLVVTVENLPSSFASGPNSTWTCEEPDCNFVVRSADDEEGQQAVNDHFEEHEQAAREMMLEMETNRVNLALQEGKKGHLPIDHLLEKIRSMAGDPPPKEPPLEGEPKPIKRSLLI